VDTIHKVFQKQTVQERINGWFEREQMSRDDINSKLNKGGLEGGGEIVLVQYRDPTRPGFRRNGQNMKYRILSVCFEVGYNTTIIRLNLPPPPSLRKHRKTRS
jgi:hypothetical protein